MTLKKQLKELNEYFHINKYLPNYINKKIFYAGLFIIILGFLFVAYSMDFNFGQQLSGSCPYDSFVGCPNLFFECSQDKISFEYIQECENLGSFECVGDICIKPFLLPGESIGQKPNIYYHYFDLFVLFIIVLCFLINHLLYLRRLKKDGLDFKSEIRKGKERLERFSKE